MPGAPRARAPAVMCWTPTASRYMDPMFRRPGPCVRDEAEDLVEDVVNVLKRPRVRRDRDELGYLLRALSNTYKSRYRSAAQRPRERN